MKRMPLLATVLALAALTASITFWVTRLNPGPQREMAIPPRAVVAEPNADAAATLFGGQLATAVATNYVLTGVIASGREGVAIIVTDGGAPKALKIGRELVPGVMVSEVYPRYVMLSDNGIMKRIDLAPDNKAAAPMGGAPAAPVGQPAAPDGSQPSVPEPPMSPGAVQGQPNMMTGQQQMPGQPQMPQQMPPSGPTPANPGAVGQPSSVPPPAAPLQMPPPTRSTYSPVGPPPTSQ